jgi:hypothetical protein
MPQTPRSLRVLSLVCGHMTPRLVFPLRGSEDWEVVDDLIVLLCSVEQVVDLEKEVAANVRRKGRLWSLMCNA